MKRTVEIEDTLPICVKVACESVKLLATEYLEENPDLKEAPELSNDLDYSGSFHEIVDGAVPIYNSEIRDIFYLHGDDVEEAFDNAGIGNKTDEGWPMGWKAAAIYCYIEQETAQWYEANKEEIYEEFRAAHPLAEEDEAEVK